MFYLHDSFVTYYIIVGDRHMSPKRTHRGQEMRDVAVGELTELVLNVSALELTFPV